MTDPTQIGATGGAGIVGVLLGWLGFRSKVNSLEKQIDSLKGSVRFEDTCKEIHKATDKELAKLDDTLVGISEEQVTIKEGIATLLERTK